MYKIFFNVFHWLRKKYWKVFHIETFGVRTLVIKNNQILLVKHRYGHYWVMPGGGINKGESPEKAAIRELREEAGIVADKIDYKLGYYKNTRGGKNDNVYCFLVTNFEPIVGFKRNFIDFLEISEIAWFHLDTIPESVSGSTRLRIKEYQAGNKDLVSTW